MNTRRKQTDQLTTNNDVLTFSLFTERYQQVARLVAADYLPYQSIDALSKTCHLFNQAFQPILVDQLVACVAKSDQTEAEKMVRQNPSLLRFPCGLVTDPAGRQLKNVTAFQAAIILKDGMMWEMLASFFKRLPDGQDELKNQFFEILPTGNFQDGTPYCLNNIANIITNSHPDDIESVLALKNTTNPLLRAFEKFRSSFNRCLAQEMHFNPNHLLHALKMYMNHFKHWNRAQRQVFSTFIMGFLQSRLPLNHLQAFYSEFYKNIL